MSGDLLALDLGSTTVRAVVHRRPGDGSFADTPDEVVDVPAMVAQGPDGHVTVVASTPLDALGTVDDIMLRLGDPSPVAVGTARLSVTDVIDLIMNALLSEAQLVDATPALVVVALPPTWGRHRQALVRDVLHRRGFHGVEFVAQVDAVASSCSDVAAGAVNTTTAVLDIGGHGMTCGLARVDSEGGTRTLGRGDGVDRLGARELDTAVTAALETRLGSTLSGRARAHLAAAREEVAATGHEVRLGPEATLSVADLARGTEVLAAAATDMLRRATVNASLDEADVERVVLVGDLADIPGLADGIHRHLSAGAGTAGPPPEVMLAPDARTATVRAVAAYGARFLHPAIATTGKPPRATARHARWRSRATLLPATAVLVAAAVAGGVIVTREGAATRHGSAAGARRGSDISAAPSMPPTMPPTTGPSARISTTPPNTPVPRSITPKRSRPTSTPSHSRRTYSGLPAAAAAAEVPATAGDALANGSVPNQNARFQLVNHFNGLVLDEPGNAPGFNGGPVDLWRNQSAPDQYWRFEPQGGTFRIVNAYSGLALSIDGHSSRPTAAVVAERQGGAKNFQQWQFVPTGRNTFVIVNAGSHLVLDLRGDDTDAARANGTHVQQYARRAQARDQTWTIAKAGN